MADGWTIAGTLVGAASAAAAAWAARAASTSAAAAKDAATAARDITDIEPAGRADEIDERNTAHVDLRPKALGNPTS